MHLLKTQRYLEQSVLDELFWKVPVFFKDDFSELASFHQLHEDPETVLKFVHFFAFDKLIAVQEGHQATLIDDVLSLCSILWVCKLERKRAIVADAQDFKNYTEPTTTNFLYDFVNKSWVVFLDNYRILQTPLDLFFFHQGLYLIVPDSACLLGILHQDGP